MVRYLRGFYFFECFTKIFVVKKIKQGFDALGYSHQLVVISSYSCLHAAVLLLYAPAYSRGCGLVYYYFYYYDLLLASSFPLKRFRHFMRALHFSRLNTSSSRFQPVRSSTFFIHLFFGLPGSFRPGTSISITSPRKPLTLRLFTWQNHLRLFSRITDTTGFTQHLLATSAKETPVMHRSMRRSQACKFSFCFFLKLHVSAPYC